MEVSTIFVGENESIERQRIKLLKSVIPCIEEVRERASLSPEKAESFMTELVSASGLPQMGEDKAKTVLREAFKTLANDKNFNPEDLVKTKNK